MTALTDDAVVQIAREAAADQQALLPWVMQGGMHAAAIRNGLWDNHAAVNGAILGARAIAAKLSGGACEPVAWLREDLIFRGDRNVIFDREHAERSALRTDEWRVTPLYAHPPAEPAVVPALQVERLIAAIEGELDGLDCHPDKALNILHYVMTGLLPDEVVPVPPEHPDSKVWRRSDGRLIPFGGGRTRAEWERIGNASMQVETEEND